MPTIVDSAGRLIYLVGPSGSGKDSLLQYCRQRLAGNPGVVFAHRYITRAAQAGGENHVALSAAEFAAREAAGLFALRWRGNGLDYGIGVELDHWLAKGMTVIVNGSREYLPQARQRYPELVPVWVQVSHEVLQARLQARGRESGAAVVARLARAALAHGTSSDIVIHNDGELADAGDALLAVITAGMTESTTACA